jgi:4-amino-4-deoxy-L-arabinose transferase-like glycosyltransferase
MARDTAPRTIFWTTLAVGTLLGLLALWVHPYALQFYGDANSRLVGARMIVDSVNPGLHWIGTVWLPLPALLFLPFSLIGPLFSTGAAGMVVCMPLLAGAAALLYRLLVRMSGDRGVSGLVALSFALNPNMLYVSMTAMTETVTLFCAIAALVLWMEWIARRGEAGAVRLLLMASAGAAGATLCRYEAWLFAAAGVAGIGLFVLPLPTTRARKAALVAAAALSFAGIGFWLAWNYMQFGDAFYFNNAEFYSAAWQARHRPVRAAYYLQLWNTLSIYGVTLVAVFGYGWLAVSTAGAALLAARRPRGETLFLLATLLVMPSFTLLSVYLGVAEMTRWWNSRYVLLLAPFVAVASTLVFARWTRARSRPRVVHATIVALYVLTTAYQAGVQHGRVVTIADAAGGFFYMQTPSATQVGELLRREWRGGAILSATGSGQSHRIIQPSGIATREYTTGLDVDRRLLNVDDVRGAFMWIIVGLEPSPDGREIATTLLQSRERLEQTHDAVFENKYYVVFRARLRPDVPGGELTFSESLD